MCGICGILEFQENKPVNFDKLVQMRDSMFHRGPDDAGAYVGENIGLGHRRLSIIDLSEHGRQPMSAVEERYWMVFNGEIYNYQSLREDLKKKGHQFHTGTDSEVLLALYIAEGPSMLNKLNGMFAFAIWDKQERSLFITRDRLGIKPLYYAIQNDAIYFASEEKALFEAGIDCSFNDEHWHELLYFRYIAGENTPFKGVKRMLPGHYMLIKNGKPTISRWWHLGEIAQQKRGTIKNSVEWFRETFDSAVNLHSISDVPVGVLLSGGLDSSSVAATLAQEAGGRHISSFTVRFHQSDYDEGDVAKRLAEKYNIDYNSLIVSEDDHFDLLAQSAWLNDEPLVHQSDLFLYAISKYAKKKVTVLLSGEGGDEILGGYVRYKPLRYPALLNMASKVVPPIAGMLPLKGRWKKLANFLDMPSIDDFVMFNSCSLLPHNLKEMGVSTQYDFPFRQAIMEEAKQAYPGDRMRQILYYDQHTFICSIFDRNDRMTMGASIECRVPFIDYRILEGVASMTNEQLFVTKESKSLLRESIGPRLTPEILGHRKMGFPVPWGEYIKKNDNLKHFVSAMPQMEIFKSGPMNNHKFKDAIDQFLKGDDRQELFVRQMMMLGMWYDVYFEQKLTNPSKQKAIA